MALSKNDKEWIVRTIKDIIAPLERLVDHFKTILHGENGNNGICGKQKQFDEKQQEMERAIIVMTEQMKQVRSSAIFWTRLVGSAALAAIGAIIVQLLLK